jgi:hypothetical protein
MNQQIVTNFRHLVGILMSWPRKDVIGCQSIEMESGEIGLRIMFGGVLSSIRLLAVDFSIFATLFLPIHCETSDPLPNALATTPYERRSVRTGSGRNLGALVLADQKHLVSYSQINMYDAKQSDVVRNKVSCRQCRSILHTN